jgi:hypothetical protein
MRVSMKEVKVLPAKKLGYNFIPPPYLPKGKDEFYLRNQQSSKDPLYWRNLHAGEIEVLVKNANTCDNWENIQVADPFSPALIKNCVFAGLVRIGRLEDVALEHHDLVVPAGITNSLVISSDIGDNCSVHNVTYLAHYIIGDNVILMNIDELHTTNYAKFGNGIIKDGEEENVRVWIDVINETGTRAILPFDGMISADAVLGACYKEDRVLQECLREMTQAAFDTRRGHYGIVGNSAVIKNSRIIKDVIVGDCSYIKGANKLKNLTINSSEEEATQIGEGVELVNGIVGYGSRIFYGCKAVRFIMGNNSNLKYGARLIHSFLGDNSTISCCEILNNLIFPAHEQHHNNSFLAASFLLGQSNVAAGVTIGSNHNSRSNDGEIHAGRGFWPGLCTSLKHTSRFASYVLLVKGDYPAELNISLPFSMVHNDVENHRLVVIPAYWWRYNMYAIARNTWKFASRDRRKAKSQNITFDFLAPDTIEEIIEGIAQLEEWCGEWVSINRPDFGTDMEKKDKHALGSRFFNTHKDSPEFPDIEARGVENSDRIQAIPKAVNGYFAYRDMLYYYAMGSLINRLTEDPTLGFHDFTGSCGPVRTKLWNNFGGQLIPNDKTQKLIKDIKSEELPDWEAVHNRYDQLWREYPHDRDAHAYAVLLWLEGGDTIPEKRWPELIDRFIEIERYICDQVYLTRKKDFQNPFRKSVFKNDHEMETVMGSPEENDFVKQIRKESDEYTRKTVELKKRLPL